ncbi:hypothetical protein HPB50_020880 [Hyalomma asiaticum]|uniref:Uncharacterized protein n=1 Tax=Hyalomma asiaticum TaxID=266040 RepID=A0ACB7TB73_HYAAI|nr:hypothetical protein HPB50_020880 [Hyalomma asiaticum]
MNLLEYAVFGTLVVANFSLGLYFSFAQHVRRGTGSTSAVLEVFLGGRTLGMLPLAASSVASIFSSTGLVAIPAHYYAYGWHLLWTGLVTLFVLPLASHVFVPVVYRLKITSIFQGGLRGVVWTDCVQFLIIICASATIVAKFVYDCISESSLIHPLDDMDIFKYVAKYNLDFTSDENMWSCFFGGVVPAMSRLCFDQVVAQRLLASRTMEDAQSTTSSTINSQAAILYVDIISPRWKNATRHVLCITRCTGEMWSKEQEPGLCSDLLVRIWRNVTRLRVMPQLQKTKTTDFNGDDGGNPIQDLSLLVYPKPHKVLSWCKSWDKYVDGLTLACLHGKHVLVVVPNNRWKNVLHQTAALRKHICPHIKWLKLERAHGKGSPQEISQHVSLHSWKNATQTSAFAKTPNNRTSLSTEALPGGARFWAALSGRKVRTGCVAYNKPDKQNSCDSTEGIAFLHALHQLNVSADVTPVRRGAFAEILRKNRADIVVISVGLTEDRYQYFDFTVNKFGQAVFHVQRRWRRRADFFLGALPWTILLALSTLISVASFALLNLRRAKRPTSALGSVVLALIATTLSFNSPLHRDHARSSSGRVVMAFWMLACFSLAAYTRSLLTASLTAKPTWEADDTFEEMLPKLHRGRLLPCAEKNSFFHVLLKMAAGNSSDVVDVMALAARRWGYKGRGFTGSFESCLERTRKGTHLLFSEGIDFCKYSRFEETIVEGEKPIRSLIGGFPIRRGYPLRAELILLTHRIFETGWDIKFSRSQDWNCSGIVENDEVGTPTV